MQLNKIVDLYALAFNSLVGIAGGSDTERTMLVERRRVILEKIKEIIVSDYNANGGGKLTTRLLPVELESSEVKRAISENYYG